MSTALINHTVAILGFHKIGDPPPHGWESWFYISEEIFSQQLEYLKTNCWEVIDLPTFLRGLAAPDTLPDRAALLTFDDGYRSLLDVASKQLRRFAYPGVVFVPTAYIGGCNAFDLDDEPEEPMCDWADLHELENRGISVQSHGVTHRSLSQLTVEEQETELLQSKAVLEEGLGKPIDVFAYPYGDSGLGRDWRTKRQALRGGLAQAGYQAAYLYGGGVQALPVRDRFRIARVAMGPDTDLERELNHS